MFQFGCLAGDVVPVVNRLTAGFCANLYVEAANIAQSGLPRNDQDFFMEIRKYLSEDRGGLLHTCKHIYHIHL